MMHFIPFLQRKIFADRAGWRMVVLTLAAGGYALASVPADAAHGPPGADQEARRMERNASARMADNHAAEGPAVTSSLQVGSSMDASPNCDRARRRLFVEGEGWIVRRVTTCY